LPSKAARIALSGPTARRVARLGLSLAVGFAIAWSWYSSAGSAVLRYLRAYGYGPPAADYGPERPWWSLGRWTFRLDGIAHDTYLPLLVAFVVSAAVAVVARRSAPTGGAVRSWRAALASDTGVVAAVLVIAYLELTTTRNNGWQFELPLVAPFVLVALALAWRVPAARATTAVLVVLASALTFAGRNGVLPASVHARVAIGGGHVPVIDGRDLREQNTARSVGLAPGSSPAAVQAALQRLADINRDVAVRIVQRAAAEGVAPRICLGTQDPWVNVNSIALDLLLVTGRFPAITIFRSEPHTTADALVALADPVNAVPNVVLTGAPFPDPDTADFDVLRHSAPMERALRVDGFTVFATEQTPDGRALTLWFRDA